MLRKSEQLRRPKIVNAVRGIHGFGDWLQQRGEKQAI
jgi:hypothetical protein